MTLAAEREELFWRLAEALYADPAVTRSTMMGFPCLRVDGEFFAGVGEPFAPNGRVFREWVALPLPDDQEWAAVLVEAKVFAGG